MFSINNLPFFCPKSAVAGTEAPRLSEGMEGGGTNHRSYQVQPAFFLLSLGGGKGDKVYIFAIKYLPGFRYYKYSVVEGGEN